MARTDRPLPPLQAPIHGQAVINYRLTVILRFGIITDWYERFTSLIQRTATSPSYWRVTDGAEREAGGCRAASDHWRNRRPKWSTDSANCGTASQRLYWKTHRRVVG